MKKFLRLFFCLLLLFCVTFSNGAAADEEDYGFSQANESLPKSASEITDKNDQNGVIEIFSVSNIINLLTNGTYKILKNSVKDFALIIGAILLLAAVKYLGQSMKRNNIKNIFNITAALTLSILVYRISGSVINDAQGAINEITIYIKALLPAFSASITAKGAFSSALVLPATTLIGTNIISDLMAKVFLPIINIYLALCLAGAVSDKVETTGFAKLVRNVAIWSVTALCTVLVSVLSIQKLVTGVTDNLATKTAKFAVGGMVPIVGTIVKDAFDTVAGSVKMISSVSGAFAIAAVIYAIIPIITRLAVYNLLFRFAASVSEMLIDKKASGFFIGISDLWGIIFAVTICEGIVFIFSVAVLISAGG